ncbi:MAG: hypothetical protein HY851_11445, partial [candidate division Zixibacteria bacterium]|nr:hypothetical protein [candidate division Zixibacteria bacterium]
MKEKNHQFCRYWPLVALVLAGTAWAIDRQDVIDYYWRNATKAYGAHDPVGSGRTLAFTATASVRQLTRGGKAKHTDTSVTRYYYSGGKLDSTTWIR